MLPTDDANPDGAVVGLGSSHKRYARVLTARVDGKQGVDLPHAVETPPFVDSFGVTWNKVLARDRISICAMIALANNIPGLSMTPAKALSQPAKQVNGVWTPIYSGANPAAYLTFDGGSGMTPGSLDTDLLTDRCDLPALCFLKLRQYPGQRLNEGYRFLKIRHGSVEGVVINPNGKGAQGVEVTATSVTHPTGEVHKATADDKGYYRIKKAFQNQEVAVTTNVGYAQGFTRNRATRWLSVTGYKSGHVVCMEIDSARGWLILGVDKHVEVYHLGDLQPCLCRRGFRRFGRSAFCCRYLDVPALRSTPCDACDGGQSRGRFQGRRLA